MIPGSGIKVELDKERELRFDMNAQVAFEEATGENTLDGAFWIKPMTAKNTRALVWACLVHEDESLTIKQVGAMLNHQNAKKIGLLLRKALTIAMPSGGGEVEEDGGKK